jgi:uncharacterized protein YndB with AHSA1/START domain
MVEIEERVVIGRPRADVFDAAADPQRQLVWDAGTLRSVEKLTDGPLAAGSSYRGDFKGFGTVDYQFSAYEPDRTFAHQAKVKMGTMTHVFSFEDSPDGTVVIQRGSLEPNAMGRLMSPMIKRMFRKRFQLIGTELNDYLASDGSAS